MANEKRLIDANAAMDGIIAQLENEWGYDGIREDVQRVFDSTPTVDAVEVVRCKNCHWWRHINKRNGCGICQHEVFSVDDCTIDPVTEPTDFCSYGERKTDNGRP